MPETRQETGIVNPIVNKVALVTGGTRGIGRAIAARLLAEGARVAICGTRQETVDAALQALGNEAPGREASMCGLVADISKRDDAAALVAATAERFGRVDILVNSAGLGIFASVADLTPADWERMIAVNLSGAFYCCHAVLPIFRTCGGGDVINISSLAGANAFAGGAGYNASKFGLNGFSDAMMQDHRNENVRVSVVMPGSVDTEFSGRAASGAEGGFGGRIAPEDVAEVVTMLLRMPRRATVSRVEIRPSRPPRK